MFRFYLKLAFQSSQVLFTCFFFLPIVRILLAQWTKPPPPHLTFNFIIISGTVFFMFLICVCGLAKESWLLSHLKLFLSAEIAKWERNAICSWLLPWHVQLGFDAVIKGPGLIKLLFYRGLLRYLIFYQIFSKTVFRQSKLMRNELKQCTIKIGSSREIFLSNFCWKTCMAGIARLDPDNL